MTSVVGSWKVKKNRAMSLKETCETQRERLGLVYKRTSLGGVIFDLAYFHMASSATAHFPIRVAIVLNA